MRLWRTGIAVLLLAVFHVANIAAAPIVYANQGIENPTRYSFIAEYSGTLKIYFAGSDARYESEIGLLINGVDSGIYGMNNHASVIGDELDFGKVDEGDVLTFVMSNITLDGAKVYSKKSLNATYDSPHVAANHVYSNAYVADPAFSLLIPNGTYVGFEDKPASSSLIDWDYNDTQFVFVNYAPPPGPPVPEPASLGLILLPVLLTSRRLRKRA